ncbi:MAG: hypothetical protein GX620_11160 [Chloroflexi bacterium]|nr:hypothetical protein [Chloroflexota bacterium]
MRRSSIVNTGLDLPLPPKEQLARRVAQMEAHGIRGFIPLVQAVAKEYGDGAYTIALDVFSALGYEVTLEQLQDPDETGVDSYPWM